MPCAPCVYQFGVVVCVVDITRPQCWYVDIVFEYAALAVVICVFCGCLCMVLRVVCAVAHHFCVDNCCGHHLPSGLSNRHCLQVHIDCYPRVCVCVLQDVMCIVCVCVCVYIVLCVPCVHRFCVFVCVVHTCINRVVCVWRVPPLFDGLKWNVTAIAQAEKTRFSIASMSAQLYMHSEVRICSRTEVLRAILKANPPLFACALVCCGARGAHQ